MGWEKPTFPKLSHRHLCDWAAAWAPSADAELLKHGRDGVSVTWTCGPPETSVSSKAFAALTACTSSYLRGTFCLEASKISPCQASLPASLRPPNPTSSPASAIATESAHWLKPDLGRLVVWGHCFLIFSPFYIRSLCESCGPLFPHTQLPTPPPTSPLLLPRS